MAGALLRTARRAALPRVGRRPPRPAARHPVRHPRRVRRLRPDFDELDRHHRRRHGAALPVLHHGRRLPLGHPLAGHPRLRPVPGSARAHRRMAPGRHLAAEAQGRGDRRGRDHRPARPAHRAGDGPPDGVPTDSELVLPDEQHADAQGVRAARQVDLPRGAPPGVRAIAAPASSSSASRSGCRRTARSSTSPPRSASRSTRTCGPTAPSMSAGSSATS